MVIFHIQPILCYLFRMPNRLHRYSRGTTRLILNVEPKQLGVGHFSLLRSGFHDAGVAGGKRMPCGRGCAVDRVGVLRLRRVMRFARDPAALRMTDRFFSRTFALSRGTCPTLGWTGGDARRSINKRLRSGEPGSDLLLRFADRSVRATRTDSAAARLKSWPSTRRQGGTHGAAEASAFRMFFTA